MSGIKNNKVAEIKIENNVQLRKCTCCDTFKTLDNFYSNCKNNPYWIDSVCKDCRKIKALNRQKQKRIEINQQKRDKKLKKRGIQSPFNYMGNKYLLLPQVIPLFPKNINTFVDLFCGSTTVGINVDANKIICTDKNKDMINFFNVLKSNKSEDIIASIHNIINQYDFEKLGDEAFKKIRDDFNNGNRNWNIFYTLVTYSFNQNPSYTKHGLYSTGYGKGVCHFNFLLEKRIKEYCNRIHNINIDFNNINFKDFDYSKLSKGDFVYADPPYLISSRTYEWSLDDEKTLLNILDMLNEKGINFALSNVLKHKKGLNELLMQWSRKYNTTRLQRNYSRMNRGEIKNTNSTEVLITNYKI